MFFAQKNYIDYVNTKDYEHYVFVDCIILTHQLDDYQNW